MLIQLPNIAPFDAPENYGDLTLIQLKRILDNPNTPQGLLNAIGNIDYDYSYVNDQQLYSISMALAALMHPVEFDNKPDIPHLETMKFVDVYAFELEAVKEITNTGDYYISVLTALGLECLQYKVSKAVPMIKEYLEQLNYINKTWAKLMPSTTTNEQHQAGVNKFDYFSRWGTVYRLAGNDLTKIERVWNMPYREVFTACFYNYTQANYEKRLHEIHHKKYNK